MSNARAQAGTLESMRGELATARGAMRALETLVADERTVSAAALTSIREELVVERRTTAHSAATTRSLVWAEVAQRDALTSAYVESLKRQNARLRNDIASASALTAEYELREADLVSALQEGRAWIESRLALEADAAAAAIAAAARNSRAATRALKSAHDAAAGGLAAHQNSSTFCPAASTADRPGGA